ncbi:MAG: hypothetical protein ACTSVA_07780 [Candidatus Njordarchaeales archaeon]
MRLTREMLESLREYAGSRPLRGENWKPMSLEQVLDLFADVEFSEIRRISGNFGDELDLFVNSHWAFSIVRIGKMYYVRKVGLKWEEWVAYATATGWALPAGIITASWFWKYHIRKYGWVKSILLVIVPIAAWWISGIISILLFAPKMAINAYAMLMISLYIGALLGLILGGVKGLLVAFAILATILIFYWHFLWREKEELDILKELEEKWESFEPTYIE